MLPVEQPGRLLPMENAGPELQRLRNTALLKAILSTYSKLDDRRADLRASNQLTESRMNWNCFLCHKECSLDNVDELSECMHLYCNECAEAYLKYKINAKEPVLCPQLTCGEPLKKNSQHFENLSADFKRRFDENDAANAAIHGNPNLILCKRLQCRNTIELLPQGPVVCKKCSTIHCRKCLYVMHSGNCSYFESNFFQQAHNPEEASRTASPQLIKLKQVVAANQAARPPPPNPIDTIAAQIPFSQPPPPPRINPPARIQGVGQPPPVIVPAPATIPIPSQPNRTLDNLVVSMVRRVPDGPLGASIIQAPQMTAAPMTQTRILPTTDFAVSRILDAPQYEGSPPQLGGAPLPGVSVVPDITDQRNSPTSPVKTKCTCINILLWVLLPLTAILTLLVLFIALLVEVFVAIGKSVVTFIKGNFAKSKSSWCTALLVVTVPFQVIAGIFGAPFILRNEQSYKFGNYLKTAFLFCEKIFPIEIRRKFSKSSGP